MRWLARFYPKDVFADRRAALLADSILLAVGVVLLLLAVSAL
jgi:hypothetical protein